MENKLTVSIRRHAETDKAGDKADSKDRILTPNGRSLAYGVGESLSDQRIIESYSPDTPRGQQTQFYIRDGAGQLDFRNMFIADSLDAPVIGKAYRKIVSAENRNRDERIGFYLENPDVTGETTTPALAAYGVGHFLASVNKRLSGEVGRVEAISYAPKLEAFLQALDVDAFEKYLDSKSFDHLEGMELEQKNGIYVVRFRDKEMQVPESRIIDLANKHVGGAR